MATTENEIYYPDDYDSIADIPKDLKEMAKSVDKKIYESIDKMNKFQQEQKTQNTNIQNNANNIEALKTKHAQEISALENLIPTAETEQAETLTLSDSARYPFKSFKVRGNSVQATRSGKNLFDVNDRYNFSDGVTVDEDDWITVNVDNSEGTTVIFKQIYTNVSQKLKVDTTYTILYEIKEVKNITNGDNINLDLVNGYTTECQFANASIQSFNTLASKKIFIFRLTTKSDFANCTTMLRTLVTSKAGSAGSITFRISVLEEEVTEDTFVYEKYGVMPSSDYRSEIKKCKDSINIKVCNKNLLNVGLLDFEEKTINGVIVKNNHNGTYSVKGTSTGAVDLILKGDWTTTDIFLKIKKGLLCYSTNLKNTDGYIGLHDHYSNRTITINANTSYNNQVVENITYTFIRLAKTSGITFNEDKVIFQLEYNSSTELIPHEEQIITFPLEEGQVLCRKNSTDYDYLSDEGIVNVLEQTDTTGTKTIEESFSIREVPLITPYTAEQQEAYNKIKELYSYKGTTHITCENEVSCIFQTGYYKDLETILNNMQAQILAE